MEYSRIIKLAPTFELANQFLVWVAQKVIAQSNLDLLLIKYDNERLKSRLKNREDTIDHIPTDYLLTESTESTKSTKLQTPPDYFPIIKPLPEKSFPLTPPPSPLSLSLSLPSTVNFLTPLVSSHNLSCPHLDTKRKVSLHLPIVNLSSVDKMKSSLKQGGKRKVTSTKSVSSKDSSKDPSSTSILMYSKAVMPYPGSPGAPYCEESNITDFLDSYSCMCTDY